MKYEKYSLNKYNRSVATNKNPGAGCTKQFVGTYPKRLEKVCVSRPTLAAMCLITVHFLCPGFLAGQRDWVVSHHFFFTYIESVC